ncbi:MAG: hybrid sensor histidine kinase/response regulator [bacterium]|nr:MAG: hybrid sensor histidine kinase/response regulator [bacterium]
MLKKTKILIADDDDEIRNLLGDVLSVDYDIEEARDGLAAINLIHKPFGLILLDVMMPDINGFQVAKYMKEKEIDTPIIFLTAKTEAIDRVQGMELGADDYVCKPFAIKELKLRIQKKLRSQLKITLRNKRFRLLYHNIVTPTGVIQGALQMQSVLLNDFYDTSLPSGSDKESYIVSKKDLDQLKKQLDETNGWIHKSTDQLIKMSQNLSVLLSDGKISLKKSHISLSSFLCDSVARNQPDKLDCYISPTLPEVTVNIDNDIMGTVIFEILDNVVLHNDNSRPSVRIEAYTKNQEVVISFRDNGRGIDPTDYQNVFEEFWSVYEEINHTRGQGVGLWICKKYIRAHVGSIWVEDSRPDKGTTFCISLPL